MCSMQVMAICIPLILFDANQAGAFAKAEAFGAEILESGAWRQYYWRARGWC